MGLIVILGVMGIVNGLWSKNLVINGSVATGDVNADWDCGYTNDDGLSGAAGVVGKHCGNTTEVVDATHPLDTGADPTLGFPPFPYATDIANHRKDVAKCTLKIGDPVAPADGGFGDQVATVTIVNAYPSYECTASMLLSNTGSIPFNIIGSKLSPVIPADGIETKDCTFGDLTEPGAAQVDPGGEKQIDCTVHVLQTAKQNTCTGTTTPSGTTPPFPVVVLPVPPCTNTATLVTYSFDIEVCVAQWNEAATFGQCKGSAQHEGPGGEVGIQGVSPVCTDENDNDGDGDVDADDSGCVAAP